jgi:phytoene dehydrogenase-like protein
MGTKDSMLRGICADRYHPDKIPDSVDTVVIGSGMSGLSAAAVLSRMGQRVLVLEQHYVAGGGSHMFQLKGGLHFDSGLHYLVPYSGILMWLATGGNEMPLRFERMGEPDGTFDRIALGSEPPFAIKHDEAHLPDLYARFPERRDDIDEFLRVSEKVLKRFPLFVLSKALPAWLQKPWHRHVLGETWQRYAGRSLKEVLHEITDDPLLAGLLAGPWMDTGAPPDRASFLLGACVARGLAIEGGAYPVGGSQELAKCLVPVITGAGGRVLVRAPVDEILVDSAKGCTTGVRLADGTIVPCKRVISSVGYHNTFGNLVSENVTEKFEIPRHLSIGDSCGFVMANIGLRGSAEELGLTCANLWYHPTREDGDMFGAIDDFMSNPTDPSHDPMIMVTFPSIKDREAAKKHANKTTCQILCMAEHAWFEQYADLPTRKRGAEYKAVKREWGERLVALLLRFYPQLDGRIELLDVSTPLSIEHYLGANQGGAVGLDQTPERFTDWSLIERLDPRTPIEGLWLTGQDTVTCGQPIVQGAGLITAFRVLGLQQSLRYLARTLPPIVRSLFHERRRNPSNAPRPELDRASQPPSGVPEVEHVLAVERTLGRDLVRTTQSD